MRPLILLVLFSATTAVADEALLSRIPDRYRARVADALLRENGAALTASFAKLNSDAERESWAFLVANLGTEAQDALTEPMLTGHIRISEASRANAWAADVPRGIFLHYVLPPVAGDEKPESWRKRFADEVAPALEGKARDLTDAALIVNRLCAEKLRLKDRVSRGSTPLQSLSRGYGNSLDASIYYCAMARSAGVPARVVTIPLWTHRTGGQAFVEVFTGRDWHYLEPCAPERKLDSASFSKELPRLPVAFARTLGEPESGRVFSRRDGATDLEVTSRYAKSGRLTIRVTDAAGDVAGDADLAMYIFSDEKNNAYMRPAFAAKTDGDGKFAFDLGRGDFLLHAAKGLGVGWTVARSAGGDATCEIVIRDTPADSRRVTHERTGRTALQLSLGAGSAGDQTGAISSYAGHPWNPFGFVGGGGQTVDLDPGRYVVQSSWRRSETLVLCALMAFEVKDGLTTVVRMPDFPKIPRPPDPAANAWLFTFPRK